MNLVKLDNLRRSPPDRPTVRVCIPFYEGLPPPAVQLNEQLTHSGLPGYNVVIAKKQGTIIQFARNELLEGEWDYAFFVDDDVGFSQLEMMRRVVVDSPDGKRYELPIMLAYLKTILDHRLKICAGYYCGRHSPHLPLVYKEVLFRGEKAYRHILMPPETGLGEVDGVGTGFMCIHRTVLDMFKSRFKEREEITRRYKVWRDANLRPGLPREVADYLQACKPDLFPPFWTDHVHDPYRAEWMSVGEDLYFCREARKLGFKIYVDWSIQVGHQTTIFITPAKYRHAYMDEAVAHEKEFLATLEDGDIQEIT